MRAAVCLGWKNVYIIAVLPTNSVSLLHTRGVYPPHKTLQQVPLPPPLLCLPLEVGPLNPARGSGGAL